MFKLFLQILSRFLNFLPRPLTLFLGSFLGIAWFFFIPIRRKTVLHNLRTAFPQKNSRQIWILAYRNYVHYGRTITEIIQAMTWKKEDYLTKTKVHGLENLSDFYRSGEGGFFLTLHLGNWELLIGSGAASGIPLDVVAKRPRTKLFEPLIADYRNRFGVNVFIETGTAKEILRSVSQGRFVGFILDQFMGPPIGLPVKFFNRLAGTTASLALFTEKHNRPVLPAYAYRDSDGVLHTVIEPAISFTNLSENKNERLYQKTQIFNDILERMVTRYPDQWLWLHRRWKPFVGTPKWVLAGMLFLFGCTTPSPITPTGIQLPPDPEIAVPHFDKESDSFEESSIGGTATPAPTPVPVPEKPKDKRKKAVKVEPPALTPNATPENNFEVLPAYKIPFHVGERLELHLGWMGLPAGTAVMEVREGQAFQGRKTYHLWGNVLSSKLVDAIYHIDNTAESFVDSGGFIPYKFLLHMLESQQNKETRVAFDHLQKKAYYWSKRISTKWGDEDQDRKDDLIPGAKDLWSALYYARTLDYELNKKQTLYVYENGKNYLVELLPQKLEMINSKAGTFQCMKILVTIKLDNILRPTGDIFMWLSDDNKKYLVKFDAKIKIGSLYGNLVSVREK